jgi:DNA repair exonuclease SbcCD ATPase subunit
MLRDFTSHPIAFLSKSSFMPPKKGVSHDDKLSGMQALMMESNDVWTLKELEKECPRRKGIIAQSVKDVLQELCDNDLVSSDKIGSGNFFWCFPADAYNRRTVQEESLRNEIASLSAELASLEAEVQRLSSGRENSAERDGLDAEIEALERELREIEKEKAKYESLNPEAIKRAQRQAVVALTAANRWTDNIYTIRSWCKKQFNLAGTNFDQNFGLDEGFDYFQ